MKKVNILRPDLIRGEVEFRGFGGHLAKVKDRER